MLFRLALALCLIAIVACRDGMSARRDGAVPDLAISKDGPSMNDGPGMASDRAELTAPEVARDTLGPDLPRDQLAPDSAADRGAREDSAADVHDSHVAEASLPDGVSDAPDPGEVRAGSDLATEALASVMDARPALSPIDSGLAAFCTGNLGRLATNGNAGAPAIHAASLAMDCCDGVELELDTATFMDSIYVSWVLPAGSGALPLDFDLSGPSRLRSFEVATKCDYLHSNCSDSYSSGFVGQLRLFRGDGGAAYEASLCVHVEQPTDSPHAFLHSFDLYVPRIAIP
jgi:hypothetical protein